MSVRGGLEKERMTRDGRGAKEEEGGVEKRRKPGGGFHRDRSQARLGLLGQMISCAGVVPV